MNDLVGISQKTDALKLSARFNEMVKWHGIPDSVIGYADRFVESAKKLYGADPVEVITMIESSLPKRVTSMLMESWGDQEITVQDKDVGQHTGALCNAREAVLATNQAITKLQSHIEFVRKDKTFPVDVPQNPADRDTRTQRVLEVLDEWVQKMGVQNWKRPARSLPTCRKPSGCRPCYPYASACRMFMAILARCPLRRGVVRLRTRPFNI